VLALEVKQYVGEGGLRSLMPRLIGRTEQALQKKAASDAQVRQWDEGSFFAALADRGDEEGTRVARSLLDWGKRAMSYVWWGKGKKTASFVPSLKVGDDEYSPFEFSRA